LHAVLQHAMLAARRRNVTPGRLVWEPSAGPVDGLWLGGGRVCNHLAVPASFEVRQKDAPTDAGPIGEK
jgi:hypothetical protein